MLPWFIYVRVHYFGHCSKQDHITQAFELYLLDSVSSIYKSFFSHRSLIADDFIWAGKKLLEFFQHWICFLFFVFRKWKPHFSAKKKSNYISEFCRSSLLCSIRGKDMKLTFLLCAQFCFLWLAFKCVSFLFSPLSATIWGVVRSAWLFMIKICITPVTSSKTAVEIATPSHVDSSSDHFKNLKAPNIRRHDQETTACFITRRKG